jgi:DNA-binding beta-propeller fold protein YncE
MNKKIMAFFSVLIILVFIGYVIFDPIRTGGSVKNEVIKGAKDSLPDYWKISGELLPEEGSLKAVTVSPTGNIYLGGNSFVSCYDKDLKLLWNLKTPSQVTSLSISGDTIFASTIEQILILSREGKIKNEWGPFEDSCIITSVSSNKKFVVFADAGNKMIFILDKGGEVKKLIGQNDGQFVIPSPYFDVALDFENNLYIANTGHRRVETRTIEGVLKSSFGEPGTAPGAFCGCCNPAHFIIIPDGFVTAEKGINRIKILNKTGEFVEYVSSKNKFVPSVPLDLASADGKTIYAANPADSRLYIFTRK